MRRTEYRCQHPALPTPTLPFREKQAIAENPSERPCGDGCTAVFRGGRRQDMAHGIGIADTDTLYAHEAGSAAAPFEILLGIDGQRVTKQTRHCPPGRQRLRMDPGCRRHEQHRTVHR